MRAKNKSKSELASKYSRKREADALFIRADQELQRGNLLSAFRLFLKAAKAGDRSSKLNVGYCYDRGVGTRRDLAAALHWYKQAYRSGDASAANNIATIWRDEQKPKRALLWFERAVRLGDDGANLDIAKHCLKNDLDSAKAIKHLRRVCESDRVSESDSEEAKRILRQLKRKLRHSRE